MGVHQKNFIHQQKIDAMHLAITNFNFNAVYNLQHCIVRFLGENPDLMIDDDVELGNRVYRCEIKKT